MRLEKEKESRSQQIPENKLQRIVNLLLVLLSISLCLCIILAYAWYTARCDISKVDIQELSPNQVQKLAKQFFEKTPGRFQHTWFDPAIGYTLKANKKHSCWNDTFRTNELGYRTKRVEKKENVFRVCFAGDSWTFGMGVTEKQAFPHQFQLAANQVSGTEKTIEGWSLALPGYNTHNELAALEAFFDQIKPDAIVLCPTINDIDSTIGISQKGSFIRNRIGKDPFLAVKANPWDSYLLRKRWKDTFDAIHKAELRFLEKKIPFFVFFVAQWYEEMAHSLISSSDIQSPYSVVPWEYAIGKWRRSEEDFGHATPEAYEIYGKIVYNMLAKHLGWNQLAEKVTKSDGSPVLAYQGPPPGNWKTEMTKKLRENTQRHIPETYIPRAIGSRIQCWGAMDWKTGSMARTTVVLIRRREGSAFLTVSVAPLLLTRSLYPLKLHISIPSQCDEVSECLVLRQQKPLRQNIRVPIPQNIPPGAAMDVIFRVPRAIVDLDLVAKSLTILEIDQE